MMSETGGYVKTVVHQQVGTIEFFHPQSNSLPGSLLSELAQTINHAAIDPLISCDRITECRRKNILCGGFI